MRPHYDGATATARSRCAHITIFGENGKKFVYHHPSTLITEQLAHLYGSVKDFPSRDELENDPMTNPEQLSAMIDYDTLWCRQYPIFLGAFLITPN